jgi:hypothetical protein
MGKYSTVGRVPSMSTVKRIAGKPVGSVGPAALGPHADLGVAVWEAFAGTAWPNTACWPLVTVSSGSTQCSGLSADAADVVLVNPTDCLPTARRCRTCDQTRRVKRGRSTTNRSVRWPR